MSTFRLPAFTLLALFGATLAPQLAAQVDTERLERLRRDQDEILRKAERLQVLMQRLQQRYEREKKPEQLQLLRDGMSHLERSGMVGDVASIRDDLAATAFTEALRKQQEVVDDLERLLNILLDRKSVEILTEDLNKVEAQARTARELEQKQRELMEQTQKAATPEPSPAEQALQQSLQQLRDAERTEADRNARQAGTRRPFLENALDRVQELLRQQQRLDQALADEAAGKTPATRAREFDLGDLTQRARELQAEARDHGRQQALGEAGKALQQEATGNDQQALQQARDRLQALLQDAPKVKQGDEKARDTGWQQLRQDLQKAGAGSEPNDRQQLGELGKRGSELAEQRAETASKANAASGERLQEAAGKLAEQLRANAAGEPDAKSEPAAKVDEAKQELAEAAAASKRGDSKAAEQHANRAVSALENARAAFQKQNPDAARKAGEMAAEAQATAQELQNAPSAEQAEQQTGEQLRQAAAALQQAEQSVQDQRDGKQPTANPQQSAATAREQLQAAEKALQQAMQQAGAQAAAEDMQAAAQRQQELQQAAKQAAEQLQQAAAQNQ